MSSEPMIESGLQVITRLIDRPSIQDLDNDLFFNKLENTDIIEIKGTICSGVTALLTKLIAKCILPLQYSGLDIDVLLINTDNKFKISELFNLMRTEISDIEGPTKVDDLVKKLLNNLKIINCYNHQQFFLLLNSLDNILLRNKRVGLITIDSISAYYWQQKNDLSYNSYLNKILSIIRKVTIEFKVVTLYTKQYHFESKKQTMEWNEAKKNVRYEVCLNRNDNSNELFCNVKTGKDTKRLRYIITKNSIIWITWKNKETIT